MQYFEERPAVASAAEDVDVVVPGAAFRMRTDRGVFSHGRLDPGTAILLRAAPAPPAAGVGLDLGCGAGPIAVTMALRSPRLTVWAIDVNERARALCAANAAAAGATNVTVVEPDDVPPDTRFDVIWSNPPIRIGKPALHELLLTRLGRLAPDGLAVLVVHKHLGADSLHRWLVSQGYPTERLASTNGYRVLQLSASEC
jgi:16S rRNA (guanine1207-N2)-methyltransferase